MISVIIPVFNLEAFLPEAVDSVLGQSFQDFEIILVDDGSADRSREIIESYRRGEPDRVRAVFQEHAGAAAARNAGIEMARGEWIAFLDGDDSWKPAKLELQLAEARRDPRLNLLSTAVEIAGENRPLLDRVPVGDNVQLELLLEGCFITLSSVLMRRELLSATRFDERLPGAQDLDLYLRLAGRIRYRFIPEPLVSYRIRAGAISDPQGTRYAQLRSHHRIMKRETVKLKSEDPPLFRRHARTLHDARSNLAHQAAYHSLLSRTASLTERVAAACAAIGASPLRIKNYRFLLQALLPRSVNRRLRKTAIRISPRRRRGEP